MLDAADKIDFASTDLVEQKKVMEFLSQYQRLLNEIRAGFFDAMQNLHQKVVDTLKADAKVETKLQEKKRTYAKQALALQARLMSAAATIAKLPPTAKAAAADLLLKVVGQFESLTSAISSLSANTAGVVDTTEIDSVVKELDVQMGDLEKKVADSERKAKAAGYQSAVKAADFALKASDATMVTLNTNLSALKTALGTEKDADKLSLIKAKIALLEHLTNRYKDWQTQVKALVDGLKAPTADNLGARTAALTAVTEALTNYSTAINSKNITGVTSATSFVGTATIGTGMVKALGPVLLSAAKAVDEAMAAYDRASDTTVRDQWNRYLTPDGQQRLANGERLYKENFQSPAMWDQFVDMSQYEGFEQIVPTSGITAANLKQLSDKYEQIVVKLFSQLFDNLPENSGFFKDFFKMMSTGTVTRKGLNALFKEYNVTVNGEVVEIKTDAAFNALMGITISNDTKKFGVIDIFNGLLSLAMTLNKEGWQGADGELGQARVSFHKLTKGHSFYVVDAPKMGTGLFKGLKSLLISKYGAKESDLQDDDAIFKMAMDKLLGDDSPLHPSFKKILSAVKEAGKGKDALVRLFVRVVNSNYVNPHQNDVYSKEGYEHRLDQEHFYLAIGADGDKGEHATDCLNTWISHFIVTGKFNPKAVIEGRLPEAADVPRVEK